MFALLGIVIFFFAWDPTAVSPLDLAPGVLWGIFTFSGLLGLQRSFSLEQTDRAIDALLGAPISRESIYLGKAIANLVFVAAVQVIAIPAVQLFYGVPLLDHAALLALHRAHGRDRARRGGHAVQRHGREHQAGRDAAARAVAPLFRADRDSRRAGNGAPAFAGAPPARVWDGLNCCWLSI